MIILASNSPRRKELLAGLDLEYKVYIIPDIDESYPNDLPAEQVAEYIAVKKANPYRELFGKADGNGVIRVAEDDIVLTADTVVILDGKVMGKPLDEKDAARMLRELSGKTHSVITGVCLMNKKCQHRFSVKTDVTFADLSDEQIEYYIEHYHPLDKAGAYGVQEWIGYVGVTRLEGSYFNVMGLPVQRIYSELQRI